MDQLAPGQDEINSLRNGGFSQDEIESYQADTTTKLRQGGFSEDEVNSYWGSKPLDDSGLKNYVKKNLETENNSPGGQPREAKNFADSFLAGLQMSSGGLFVRGKMPDIVPQEHATRALRIAQQIGSFLGDVPAMVAGGAIGGAAGAPTVVGAPIGAMAGAFAVPQALRKYYSDLYQKGSIQSPGDFADRLMGVGYEGLKGAVTGASTAAAGAAVGPGLAIGAELATMTTVGSALEGHLPKPEDFEDAAVVLGGLHAVSHLTPKLANIYAATGEKPSDVVDAAQRDVILKQDLLSDDPKAPIQAQPTELQHFSQKEGTIPETGGKPEIPPPDKQWSLVPKEEPQENPSNPDVPRSDAEKEVLSKIGVQPEAEKPTFKEKFDDWYAKNLDYLDPLKSAINEAKAKGVEIPSEENAYEQGRLFAAHMDKVRSFLEYGTRDAKTDQINGEGLNQIYRDVPGGDLDGYRAYALAKRGLEVAESGKTPWADFNPDTAKQVVQSGADKFESINKRRIDFQNRVLAYGRDKGLYDNQAYNRMIEAGKNYLPLSRIQEPDMWTGKIKGTANVIKKFFGSENQIVDPILQTYKNTEMILKKADINEIRNTFVKNMSDANLISDGEETENSYLTRVSPEMRPIDVQSKELSKILSKQGFDIKPDDITLFRPEKTFLKDNQVMVVENGKRQIYEGSPGVIAALKRLDGDQTAMGLFGKTMGVFANTERLGVILDPGFGFSHFFRSQVMASIYSKTGMIPFLSSAMTLKDFMGKTAVYQDWLYHGGASSSWLRLDDTYLKGVNLENIDPSKPMGGEVFNTIKDKLSVAETFIKLTDNMSRLAEYKRSIAQGVSPQEAAFRSRQVIQDYQKAGLQRSALRTGVAFLGAHIGSLDRMAEEMKADPKGFVAKMGMISTASGLLWAANNLGTDDKGKWVIKPDPVISDLPDWQKNLYWNFNISRFSDQKNPNGVGDYIMRLPKPWAPGVMFGSGLEVALDSFFKDKSNEFPHFAESFMQSVLPHPIPNLMQPILDQYSNKNGFTGRPLVSSDREKALPELKYDKWTSETAKQVAKLIGYIPLVKDIGPSADPLSSGAVVENYIKSWGGSVGAFALKIADMGLQKAGIGNQAPTPEKSIADYPFLDRFIVRFPDFSLQSVQDFYENKDKADQVLNSVRLASKEGNPDLMNQVIQQHPDLGANLDQIGKSMSTARQVIDSLMRDPKQSPSDKRQNIDTLLFQIGSMAKMGNQQIKEFQKALDAAKKEGK